MGLPRAIEDFNIAFQPACTKILNTLEAIGDGTPSGSQKAAIDEGLNSLLIAAQAQAAAATTIKGDLSTYLTGLVSDVTALGDGIGILEASLANGSQYVQTLKNVLTENFIDVQSRLSPCEVIVTMNLNIQVSVDEAGAPQPAIAAVIAQTLVTGLSDNVKNAMDPLQIVMDSWGTLQAKIDAVIADLKSVSSDYVAILRQFDLETARTQWDQLSQYAAGLLPAQSQNIG